ncbi:MAG: mannonate dehydratase [Deltaproteobacteria bacterium]|nr:mannonate dehydratase [Deltaproteobacteria bacterium]
MAFEHTWRWFGPNDPITLREIKQVGVTGIVTALHHIPVGEIWTIDEIMKRKHEIEKAGLTWSVVESLPVHENIKKGSKEQPELIRKYRESMYNLAQCGIRTICYNFMPVLDWSRTDLNVPTKDGTITTRFDQKAFAAFDLYILNRPNAEKDYSPEIITEAEIYFKNLGSAEKEWLIKTILFGLPGSLFTLSLNDFKKAVIEYNSIGEEAVRENLYKFIREVAPAAEEYGLFLAIHPDDPPWTLLGLPRVAGSRKDIEKILDAYDSIHNGITFCTGSLGAGFNNDLTNMVRAFANKINFAHLRSLVRDETGNFIESSHLEGDIDLYTIMKELLIEQKGREQSGMDRPVMPMRPDHGQLMLFELEKNGIYPGYSLLGRMRGLSELKGLELGITRSINL